MRCLEIFFFIFSLWNLGDDSILTLPEAGSSAIPSFSKLFHILPGTFLFSFASVGWIQYLWDATKSPHLIQLPMASAKDDRWVGFQ